MKEPIDPRVLFAAERTLLAWNRTSLTQMAFGFTIERFGLFIEMLAPDKSDPAHRSYSFWIGLAFVLLGVVSAFASAQQYQSLVRTLDSSQVPAGHRLPLGLFTNLAVAAFGILLMVYLTNH